MTDASKFQFTNPSVPKAYEEFFVPRLFEPWAALLLDEAKLKKGQAVIDAATGAFDVVLCQQGLQFFPDRPAALREMKRVLKPDGHAVIAVWAAIARNQIFAAFHAALRAATPPDLAGLITAPFSWHSSAELKAAAEEAGFRKVRLLTRSLPMVMEKGLEQAVQSFSATPVSPGVAA